MKSLFASLLILCLSLNSLAQKFKERYMYRYNGEDSLNLELISKELYNKQGKIVFAEYFDYFDDLITDESFNKGKYYYTYNDTFLIKELYAGYAYQFDVWGNSKKLDTSNFADSSIIEYTYTYDSINRIINKTITDCEKRPATICGFGANIKKDSALYETDEWYRNSLIDEMNAANDRQINKKWTARRKTIHVYKYYDDEQDPMYIESIDDARVYSYIKFRYNHDKNNVLINKTTERYDNYSRTTHFTLSSIVHTRYYSSYYVIHRVHIYNMAEVAFSDTTATLNSKSTTYYLDNKKRIIQIHNKGDMKGDIFIHRRKDGNFTKIVAVDNSIAESDKNHKVTLLFKYK